MTYKIVADSSSDLTPAFFQDETAFSYGVVLI